MLAANAASKPCSSGGIAQKALEWFLGHPHTVGPGLGLYVLSDEGQRIGMN